MSTPVSRRAFIRGSLAAGSVGVLGLAVDSFAVEPHRFSVEHVDLVLDRLPQAFEGFRVAQISDLHYRPNSTESQIAQVAAELNRLQPNLVVITGDFVTLPFFSPHSQVEHLAAHRTAALNAEPCARILSQLTQKIPTIAILGNHDSLSGSAIVTDALTSHHIELLRNRAVPIERGGARLWVAGLEDALEGKPDLDLGLRGIPGSEPVILLVHEPDFADLSVRRSVDLQLSGHSHGGQIRMPLVGPLYLPSMARKYPSGLRKLGSMYLYTNRGIGTFAVSARFLCTPEITIFTLKGPKSTNSHLSHVPQALGLG